LRMTRISRSNLAICFLLASFDPALHAATRTAASCNSVDVQATLIAAQAGDIVVIPAGNCTWTVQVAWAAPANVTLHGAGSTSIVGGNDQTVISDGYASNAAILSITTNASGTFRMYGITFRGGAAGTGHDKWDGIVSIFGNSSQIRVDHSHFDSTSYSPALTSGLLEFQGCTAGVVDKNIFDNPVNSVNNSLRLYNGGTCNNDALGMGDQSWTQPTGFGTANFVFVEDNVFNSGAGNDCTKGGRYVWRHNTMNMTAPAPSVQTHPTGGGARERGCRAMEIYSNMAIAQSGNYINAFFWISSGTALVWDNTFLSSPAGGGTGYRSVISGHEMRYDTSTYTQIATPNGWGYCSNHQTGTGSAWDQNTAMGYPCIDQPGRGIGQLLVNDFPSVQNNSTGTIAWPNQALEPVYEWMSHYSPVPSNPSGIWSEGESGLVVANRDYYLGTTDSGTPITFDGTSGVGSGLSSARPSTCTPKVAYWSTDTATLYQCSSTNTWSLYYKPYTYPHPLTQGTGGSQPNAPTNLQLTVQ